MRKCFVEPDDDIFSVYLRPVFSANIDIEFYKIQIIILQLSYFAYGLMRSFKNTINVSFHL